LPSGSQFSVAIVAALEREVWPLVKNWKVSLKQYEGKQFKVFENAETVLVCGGIGAEHARRATEAIIKLYRPELIISAGFAGALQADLRVGEQLTPRWVVNANDGSRSDTEIGEGILVTTDSVVSTQQKKKLADAYGAQAVDMEAAAVARGAQIHGVGFVACKVISDLLEFQMPPVQRFIENGQFQTARFAFYVAVRPWLWKSVLQLARNSATASRALSRALAVNDFRESAVSAAASNRSSS
jgi:adenosylhomocysteine nucleosidase